MRVFTFSPKDYFGSNMYILDSDGCGAVIDPSVDYSDVKDMLEDKNIKIKYIILTHVHFDHIFSLDSWKENTEADVIVGKDEAPALKDPYLNCYKIFLRINKAYNGDYKTVKDGDLLQLGDNQLQIIETPGHSTGSISIFASDMLFVGDTVFAGNSVGRTDLPGGNTHKLYASINKLSLLPPDTTVYTGHGESTTVLEIKSNFI